MSAMKLPIARAALSRRVALRPRSTTPRGSAATGRVLYTTTAKLRQLDSEDIRDTGTSGRFNKSGGSTNNNYAYIGGIALLLGAAFWMFTGKPDKVAKEAIKDDPKFAEQQRGSRVK